MYQPNISISFKFKGNSEPLRTNTIKKGAGMFSKNESIVFSIVHDRMTRLSSTTV